MGRFDMFPQLTRIENLLKELVNAQKFDERLTAIEATLAELKVAKDNDAELADLAKQLDEQSDRFDKATEPPAS